MTIILSKEEQQQYDELKQNFINYYNTVLVPQLQQKEDFRLQCVKSFWRLVWIAVFVLPLLMFCGFWAQGYYQFDSEIIFNLGFGLCAITAFVLRGPFAKYRKRIKDDIIEDVEFFGGCNGNLKGIGILIRGMNINDIIPKLSGLPCGSRPTSCPDQLTKGIEAYLEAKKAAAVS